MESVVDGFLDSFLCWPIRRLAYGGSALVPKSVPTIWRKCLSMNEKFFFRMVASDITIV